MKNVKGKIADVNVGLITFSILPLPFYINQVNSLHAL